MSQRAATSKTSESKTNTLPAGTGRTKLHSHPSSQTQLLQFHSMYGNRAVQRMHESGMLQTKLKIGQPGDKYEQEADRVADQVMRMPDSNVSRQEDKEEKIQTKPLADQITPLIQRKEKKGKVQKQTEEEEAAQGKFLQRQEEEKEAPQAKLIQPKAEEEDQVQTKPLFQRNAEEEEDVQTKSFLQREAEEDDEVQKQPVEEERLQTKPASGTTNFPSQMANKASEAIVNKGSGQPLSHHTQSRLESGIGADYSSVRVHNDSTAHNAAKGLKARAFTHGSDIWLGEGQSPDDVKLMAHEATHVVQQNAAPRLSENVSRKTDNHIDVVQRVPVNQAATETAGKAKGGQSVAPGVMELKGKPKFEPDESIDAWLDSQPRKTGSINMQFGGFAKGTVKIKKSSKGYKINQEFLPAKHEMFAKTGEAAQKLQPGLIISTNKSGDAITGYVGLRAGSKIPKGNQDLIRKLRNVPDIIGLQGFDFSKLPKITNEISDGNLRLGLSVPLSLGRILNGTFSFGANEEKITSFNGNLSVEIPKLATVNMEIERTSEGKTKGKADAAVQLTKNITGNVIVIWDDGNLSGEGSVEYSGDKFSGKVTLNVMEREKADQLEQEKKAPGKEVAQKRPAKGKSKPKADYVLFGEGELDVQFSDWLGGKAQVIIDQKGFLTVIGKITPKDFELFPQKDYVKKLFKVEARASYGIPVVGNIFIFANIGADAFAKIGPGKFYKISIDGAYSNDPKKAKDFSIRGTFNISAAAGLRLRGEAGAGLEILAHDIKAGAGINGIAGIRGYAEATPIIGYREKPAPKAEDKKGEFYIRGDLEIAAQPFLGLSGDLFVEIDAPWWSPVPDKKWTWPLGSKEWPIGGSFGLNASVDYVFGSGKAPAIELKPVEFDSNKFLTDLYADKAQPKSKKAEQKGSWKEKNTKDSAPPKEAKGGNAQLGKAEALPAAKSKVTTGGAKKDVKPADPNARTAEGKTVKEYQKEALKKEGKPDLKEPTKGKGREEKTEKADTKKEKQAKWQRGVTAVMQALSYADKTGIGKRELDKVLKKIQKRKEYGFKRLYALEDKNNKAKWVIMGSMSPDQPVGEVNNLEKEIPESKLQYFGNEKKTNMAIAKPLSRKGRNGSETKRKKGWPFWWKDVETFPDKNDWKRLHLIHHLWGRGNKQTNLVPGNTAANSAMTSYEHPLKDRTDNDEVLWYKVKVKYRSMITYLKFGYGDYFPEYIKISYGFYDESKSDKEGKVLGSEKKISVKEPSRPDSSNLPPPIQRKAIDKEDAFSIAKEMHEDGHSWADITWAFNEDIHTRSLKKAKWQNLARDTKKRFGDI